MNRLLIAAAAATAFCAGPVMAQSAKFAATTSDQRFSVVSVIDSEIQPNDCNINDGYTFATMKVPQDKEILVGLSAEVLLVTDTSIKGKDGGYARSLAYAGAGVTLSACPVAGGDCTIADPGSVILADRFQILDGTLGGVLTNCTDSNGDGVVGVDECELTDEEIGLVLDTLSSHHFNFVLPNMDQGEYDIVAHFGTEACNEVSSDGDAEALAFAVAAIGKYSLTAQQVRATKDGIMDLDM